MAAASQPFYTVQLNVEGCAGDIRVNGAPVYENQRGIPFIVEIPDNHLLRSGPNQLTIRMSPMPGRAALDEGTRVSAIVYMRESGQERDARREVARLEYPGAAGTPEDAATVIGAPFDAAVPFPLFRWFTSPPIDDNAATRDALIRELERIYSLLEQRDMAGILTAVGERDREHASAYYQTVEEQLAETRRMFANLFDPAEYTLRPLRTKNVRLRIFGNGRLARLDLSNGASPIYYMMAGEDMAAYVTLIFCKDPRGGWLVIR